MARPLRVALIGCGNIGARVHAPAYAHIPRAQLVAVCDVQPDRAQAVAQATGAEPVLDYHAILARDDVDAVDIALPTYLHASVAIEALAAGKHVFCEKPIAATLEEAEAMLEAAQRARRFLMVGHVRRFDPRYRAMWEDVQQGEIGRPVHLRRVERQHLPFPGSAWYWHPKAGGGIFRDIGVHVTDMFHWFFGGYPQTVYAVGHQVRPEAREACAFDHAFVMVHFPDGRTGLAEISWAYPPGFGPSQYGIFEVIGTQGRLVYQDREAAPLLEYTAEGGMHLPHAFSLMSSLQEAFVAEITHFVRVVLGEAQPVFTAQEARNALAVALAAEMSARTGKPVSLKGWLR